MLNRLTTRVGKLKQVLEDILNDDQEMEDMYLGRRAGELSILRPHPACNAVQCNADENWQRLKLHAST